MIPVGADYLIYEAMMAGATPVLRFSFLPYYWPAGVNDDGIFVYCAYVATDRVQADYHGFSGGYWISEVITSNLQVSSSAVITWDWNSPGFVSTLYYRGADSTTALAAASWVEVDQSDPLQIYAYYQFKLTLEGYRAWAEDEVGDADDFTAWAEDTPEEDEYQGYAADTNVIGDVITYIEAVELLGEFTIDSDVEEAGSITLEVPTSFDDLVAGDHSGLLLNNRQGSFDDDFLWTPAPLYSPNKSSFFLSTQDWYGIQLRIDFAWSKMAAITDFNVTYGSGQTFGAGDTYGDREAEGALTETLSEFITLFLGKITKWGPVSRSVDQDGAAQPNTVEVYAADWIVEMLQKRVALPASDGAPTALTYGEYLCNGEAVSGWSPAPVYRSAYFEADNYNELDQVEETGGGAVSLITPGITGTRAFRAEATGAVQNARGVFQFADEIPEVFITGTLRFHTVPADPHHVNISIMNLYSAGLTSRANISVNSSGMLYSILGGASKFNVLAYIDVPLSFAVLYSAGNPGYFTLWINGDEVLSYVGNTTGDDIGIIKFGLNISAQPEAWVVDFENIEIRTEYYYNAFQVTGYPFESIGSVYVDNLAQADSQNVGGFIQTLTRYPEYGIVTIESTDPDFKPSGDVLIRVVEHAGGRHALEIISSLLALAGLTDYVDADSLAAAYVACPDDIINARFEGEGERQSLGLKDIASGGITVADCLKEITARCLYWIFVDAGKIKIVPYTGTPPAAPDLALTASNKWENTQVIDLEKVNDFVTAVYGWYSRNSSLFYVAGVQAVGGQGTGLDFTWDSPVACEDYTMVKAKADLFLKYLSAIEYIDPVRMNLKGIRVELMDQVSVDDELLNDTPVTYWVTRKEIGLDQGSRETSLQLTRFLGE